MTDRFYITTPLYYVNAAPHLGGTYTTLVCDTIARYKRMLGLDVKLLTGTDEHGQKIERAAGKAGIAPRELADRVFAQYEALWPTLGLGEYLRVRTTEARHTVAVQEIYRLAKANGYIYKGEYAGWYCVSDEAYAPESDPSKPALCPDCGRETEWFTEESYFFKLSVFGDRLLEYYQTHPDFVRPETRLNEIASFVRGGLRDLSISRATLKWGIPLPDDPEHVFYVWFDALTGYMTGVGYQSDPELYDRYWPADVHLVGKDILRFHAVYWPAFLMAAGLRVPKTIFGHGWWLFKDEKMSKSRGNVLAPELLRDVFGIETLRYFLLREMVFGQDCNFSFDAIIQRANSDLANDLGNLLSRTVAMLGKYSDGVVSSGASLATDAGVGDADVVATAERVVADYLTRFENYEFSRALECVWELIARINKYIVENQPWVLARRSEDAGKLGSVLFHSAESLRIAAVLLAPVMPETARAVWNQLGLEGDPGRERIDHLAWSRSLEGVRVRGGDALFPRLDPEKIYARLETSLDASAKGAASPAANLAPLQPTVTIDDFAKLDLRVATVLEAEPVKGADKLLRLVVDLGFETRQVLAGIAKAYDASALVGRKVVVVANLRPRKLRGLESNGMIVAASLGSGDGSGDPPVLAGFLEDVPNGARLS
jgi:methionyl-tRNA synthetase